MDEEDEKLVSELAMDEELTLDKLLGFRLPKTKCFIPFVPCGYTTVSLLSLVPMYEAVIFPVYSYYWPYIAKKPAKTVRISEDSIFRAQHGLNPSELALLAEKGRVIPYFGSSYVYYDEKLIRPLLNPGVPRISRHLMMHIRRTVLMQMSEEKTWSDMCRLVNSDIKNTDFPKDPNCAICLSVCYVLGLRKRFQELGFPRLHACLVSYSLTIRIFDAVLQTRCLAAKDVLSNIGGLPEGISFEYILKGLKVNYLPNMPLEEYVDIFDGKTSKALRKIVADLLSDPLSRKYTQRLSAKIYDLNQQVEEIAEGKAAKVFEAISDMALYGGKKFIESKTQQYIKIPKRGFVKLGEWLASKGVDLQAKIGRKDWSVAQLYKARCKLEKCK